MKYHGPRIEEFLLSLDEFRFMFALGCIDHGDYDLAMLAHSLIWIAYNY